MDPPEYNSCHRAFLQAIFAKPTITFAEARPILSAILTAYHDRPVLPNDILFTDFINYIHTLNTALSPFDYEIRSTFPQTPSSGPSPSSAAANDMRTDETAIYALVNATSDPQTALATGFSADEIAFVRRLLDYMFEKNNSADREVMAFRKMDAGRLAKVPGGGGAVGGADLTQTQTQIQTQVNGDIQTQTAALVVKSGPAANLTIEKAGLMVDKLVAQGWLEIIPGGYYVLTPKSLMELRQWLIDTYNEPGDTWQRIKMCEGCKQIVTIGQKCQDQTCSTRLHNYCAETFFRGQTSRRCPSCREEWNGEHVGPTLRDENSTRRR